LVSAGPLPLLEDMKGLAAADWAGAAGPQAADCCPGEPHWPGRNAEEPPTPPKPGILISGVKPLAAAD